ncbi:GL14995 [Drosophila persimilis]|uniref:MICOS complex subunit MIC10 n=1 Tax=Drosophila persimilis TaxID=7234 RepID=B4H0J5_DROPE|nr:MICOS complex subunit Mic10 [Drosophila persimilis]EDW29790.1 GL14995 [Drosophila persimilis]
MSSSCSDDSNRESLGRCVCDVIVKAAGGMVIGAGVSLWFLRRRRWPVWMGAGFGVGLACRNCEKDMKALKWGVLHPPSD